MRKTHPRDIVYISLFLLLVLALWAGLSFLPGPAVQMAPDGQPGRHDLAGLDFSDTVYHLPQQWDTWIEKLHTPAQLAETDEAPVHYGTQKMGAVPYATFRVRLGLTPGVTYGITQRSSDFAMRLWVDGEEVVTVGHPAATEEENVPTVRPMVYYFTPRAETVELVVQSSNYVHYRDGTKAPHFFIGTAENIADYLRNQNLETGIVFGCLMVTFLYHLAIFLLNRRQRASLLFALLCLAVALIRVEGFATLLKNYNWLLIYRLGYLLTIGGMALLVLLVNTLFPGVVHKWVLRGYLLFCAAYLCVALLAHTLFVSRVLTLFEGVSMGVILYCLVRLALLRQRRLKNTLAFLGIALYGLSAVYDILHRTTKMRLLDVGEIQIVDASTGLVLLVACYAMVLALDQAEVNHRLDVATTELAEAEERYNSLAAREAQNGQTHQTRLADFGLTKRETEVALLLLAGKSREEIVTILFISRGTVNFHCNNLYRKTNVGNVAELGRLVSPDGNGEIKSAENTN